MKTVSRCRLCDSENTTIVWDFDSSPLPNTYKEKEDLQKDEPVFPLRYFKCGKCHSIQLKDEVSPDILFSNYSYASPPNLIGHFSELASTTSKKLNLPKKSSILDIGSNNGLLLQEYKKLGFNVLGIEPSNIAEKAMKAGVRTINQFWNKDTAYSLNYIDCLCPSLIVSTNTFAHIPDLNEYVECLKEVMTKESYFVFENAYLLNTLQNVDFGQAYFEHIFMHSLIPLQAFFKKHGLELFYVEHNKVQMGSIRGYVRFPENNQLESNIEEQIKIENDAELTTGEPYLQFFNKIKDLKVRLTNRLDDAKRQNKSISVYAWPAKMTLVNKFFDLEKYFDYIIEESDLKTGKFAPGTELEVKSLNYFKENSTDCCLIGAYNFANDIKNKNAWYKGEWINPLE